MTDESALSTTPSAPAEEATASTSQREQELRQIHDALRGLRFGSVSIVVQDGVVVQIDRTEKRRLRRPSAPAESSPKSR